MQQLMLQIVKLLVDDEQSVRVNCMFEDEEVLLSVQVAPSDVGKLIGKHGRTARSLRTILSATSKKFTNRYTLDIAEIIS